MMNISNPWPIRLLLFFGGGGVYKNNKIKGQALDLLICSVILKAAKFLAKLNTPTLYLPAELNGIALGQIIVCQINETSY